MKIKQLASQQYYISRSTTGWNSGSVGHPILCRQRDQLKLYEGQVVVSLQFKDPLINLYG